MAYSLHVCGEYEIFLCYSASRIPLVQVTCTSGMRDMRGGNLFNESTFHIRRYRYLTVAMKVWIVNQVLFRSPGYGLFLTAETTEGVFYHGEAISKPKDEPGNPLLAEDVGHLAACNLLNQIYSVFRLLIYICLCVFFFLFVLRMRTY